jgi:hypothetical protein
MSICHIPGDEASDGFVLVPSHDGTDAGMLPTSCAPSGFASVALGSTRERTE